MDFEFDFNQMVEEFLEEYDFAYHYDEAEDLYMTGVTFEDLGDVTILIMNSGSKINIVGEIDFVVENDLVYYRVSDFVHRFNSMDCVVSLFLDPDAKRLYFKKNSYVVKKSCVSQIVNSTTPTAKQNAIKSNAELFRKNNLKTEK